MSLLAPSTAGEAILAYLKDGDRKTTDLLSELSNFGNGVTKQAFYAALRKLKAEEVVVVYGKRVAINVAWIRDMQNLLGQMERSYSPDSEIDLPVLSQKESVSYTFSNTRHLDTFWGHTQSQIILQTPINEAVYSYDPHYWFYIARRETEQKLIREITEAGRQFLMTVGGSTSLDKALLAEFTDDLHQYHTEPLFPKKNYYVVVIGEYVTEVWLDERIADLIDQIYKGTNSLTDGIQEKLEKLLITKARHRIKISRNSRKSSSIRKRLEKNFFVRTTN